MRLIEKPEEDGQIVWAEDYACFKVNLEKTMESELGQGIFLPDS